MYAWTGMGEGVSLLSDLVTHTCTHSRGSDWALSVVWCVDRWLQENQSSHV